MSDALGISTPTDVFNVEYYTTIPEPGWKKVFPNNDVDEQKAREVFAERQCAPLACIPARLMKTERGKVSILEIYSGTVEGIHAHTA